MNDKKVVVAITGASGMIYAVRLIEVFIASEWDVHLIISPSAYSLLERELNLRLNPEKFDPVKFGISQNCVSELFPSGQVHFHDCGSYMSPLDGMVICPCTMGTLGHIASGTGSNLIHRAADVHLKEHRKLVLVPRETPLSNIHLRNMLTLSEAGAVILPAAPGFYHCVKDLRDIVNFVVSRICDQFDIENNLIRRWKLPSEQERDSEVLNDERFVELAG